MGLLRFNKPDIFAWDEGLFALRAKGILQFNNWWDQTKFSPGGLYSSTYPPLNSWMIAISIKFFGENEFSVRLFTSLCAILFLFIFYRLSLRFLSPKYAIISCILLSTTILWNTYIRQGMADIPLLTFIILSLFSIIKIDESNNKKYIIMWSLFLILAISSGLMLKIVKSFLPYLFILIFIITNKNNFKRISVSLAGFMVLIIPFPWYYYMIRTYGSNFYNALFPPHIFNAVESNIKASGVFYYFNQMIISNPFLIVIFIVILFVIFKFQKIRNYVINNSEYKNLIYLVFWFAVTLLIFSISVTKMPNYTLYIIPPALILSLFFIENDKILFTRKSLNFIFLSIILSLFWYFLPNFRAGTKNLDFNIGYIEISILMLALSAIIIYTFYSKKLEVSINKSKFKDYHFYIISSLLIYRILFFNLSDYNTSDGSGKIAGDFVTQNILYNFIYLYHHHNDADSLNPQLGWYTNGQLYGWLEKRKYTPIPLKENKFDIATIKKTDSLPFSYLIYAIANNQSLAKETVEEIAVTREILFITKDYVIFGKRKKIRHEHYI